MNYKKTWTHIKILQKNIADQLVIPQKGGGGSGGTALTPKARELVRDYRQLQREIEEITNRRFAELFFCDLGKRLGLAMEYGHAPADLCRDGRSQSDLGRYLLPEDGKRGAAMALPNP